MKGESLMWYNREVLSGKIKDLRQGKLGQVSAKYFNLVHCFLYMHLFLYFLTMKLIWVSLDRCPFISGKVGRHKYCSVLRRRQRVEGGQPKLPTVLDLNSGEVTISNILKKHNNIYSTHYVMLMFFYPFV